ncbi:Scr1 family TA system antitoxin-like transcriptional regulator [Streptomyces virginiae]|uniref:Scr1 family TA system antitoxin-like transcriptional regulator n=1 Tax=Streptomyces virginiae TaxID=1961 RepID=UPI001FCB623E|nr:Scr1 family TA system antitoxin-like transcriptional regulator [Streptomyces virginiae]
MRSRRPDRRPDSGQPPSRPDVRPPAKAAPPRHAPGAGGSCPPVRADPPLPRVRLERSAGHAPDRGVRGGPAINHRRLSAAESRIERSRVLHEGSHRFALLPEETVLRYRIGDASAMAGQLGHLPAVMALPNVSLGVIPFTAQRFVRPLGAFHLFDGRQASVELLTAAVNVTAPSEVATYAEAFSELSELAVCGAPTRALISDAITSLGQCGTVN